MSAQIVYLSHGGGPLPLLGDAGHLKMVEFLRSLPGQLKKPEAILVISAHWEEFQPAVLASARPGLFFDYYGFPPQTYRYAYPAPGAPHLAAETAGLLQAAGFQPKLDRQRDFDHGVFIPLMISYPKAVLPVFQISILASLAPADHLLMGKALRPLLRKNLLVIGSGFSFHNLRAFSWGGQAHADVLNDDFQNWLRTTIHEEEDQEKRETALLDWSVAPGARHAHPREDHLLPLHVCAALAGRKGDVLFDDLILGKRALAFGWF